MTEIINTAKESFLISNISQLCTCDENLGTGPLGVIEDAAVVIENDRFVWVGPNAKAPKNTDRHLCANGVPALPGFVDSHTHLVFAGDRAQEFTSRMAGKKYDGGGIRHTTEATRSASEQQLHLLTQMRLREALAAGSTTVEIKSGYGLNVEAEARSCEIASAYTDEVTFLGAHLVPEEFSCDPDGYIDLVCGEMLQAVLGHARWIDVFCETGAFDEAQSRKVLEAGKAAGLGLRVHGNQLGYGPGVALAVEMGAASVDHCTYLSDSDIDALANSDTVATFLPATDFSTREPYPDARRVIDAGVNVAMASNCNPGSSFTTSISFCIALAVRDMFMSIEEAILAVTVGGARALRRDDIGSISVGKQADLVLLNAPSYHHLAYRPGVPMIDKVITA